MTICLSLSHSRETQIQLIDINLFQLEKYNYTWPFEDIGPL